MISGQSPPTASVALFAYLAQGLHAAAQPLTILLAGLGDGHTIGMNAAELRELTASSASEVQRVCNLFSSMQKLIMAESLQPELSSLSILPVLAHVTERLTLLFEKGDLSLRSCVPDACPLVLINRDRTHQALSCVLLVARTLSRKHDAIDLLVTSTERAVNIVVQNNNAFLERLSAEMSLNIAVAETNIRSQLGGFCCSLRPFRAHIELPCAALE